MEFIGNKGSRNLSTRSIGHQPSESANLKNVSQKKQAYVEIDSLVLIKALKHCKDNYPVPVNGQLLGLDVGDKLEVTNCFPYPQKRDIYNALSRDKSTNNLAENEIEEKADEEFVKYQEKMTDLVHDIRVDCFAIGWYQTINFGDLQSKEAIDNLVIYQEVVDKAIMLGFDPVTNTGEVSFKAYRASDQLLSIYHSAEGDVQKFNALKGTEILEEVPIVIKNSILSEVFLSQYFLDCPVQNTYIFDVLDADHNNYLEKNLEFLSQSLEALCDNQEKFIRYQRDYTKLVQQQKQLLERRRLENEQCKLKGEPLLPMPELDTNLLKKIDAPSQLSTIIMSNECTTHTKDVNSLCFDNIAKMYLIYHRLNSKQAQK
ncbi:eukaryotic translation initiation factor 3, putative [Theileria equi strain WA]|uniref:Eukaryotic translation initiation factor 3 subunit H n=1 Tax=Theileria equi strain WA TaxID=1537102 RepID=L0AU49_THEEQ|nr:eukaryotic translation initiation factor 3, putative [Theileria equi strain WA]AFZ79172.1 eukaryotic translation initiation factor 3, putative [Theileria equi strain WA]|eukprot:XP_004828838.1 eukaryotic translation initiation factor 3, putative [Theileria equi strain WA]